MDFETKWQINENIQTPMGKGIIKDIFINSECGKEIIKYLISINKEYYIMDNSSINKERQ